MPLDPQVEEFLKQMQTLGSAPMHQLGPDAARRQFSQGASMLATTGRPAVLDRVEDVQCPTRYGEVPIRLYLPRGKGPRPFLVFYHGGAFVLGDIQSYDQLASTLAEELSCVVASVGYHLAPEAKFPRPVEESYEALTWLAAQDPKRWDVDPDAMVVAGDSAGGNLAAVMAQLVSERGGPPLAAQILYYPAVDMGLVTESKRAFATGLFLEWEDILWFGQQYLATPADAESPLASPLRRAHFSDLPPSLIITAEYDPLRDEGELYAKALEAAGVKVELRRVPGMVHGFLSVPFLRARHDILRITGQFLQTVVMGSNVN